jgi:hypothetical protein
VTAFSANAPRGKTGGQSDTAKPQHVTTSGIDESDRGHPGFASLRETLDWLAPRAVPRTGGHGSLAPVQAWPAAIVLAVSGTYASRSMTGSVIAARASVEPPVGGSGTGVTGQRFLWESR